LRLLRRRPFGIRFVGGAAPLRHVAPRA